MRFRLRLLALAAALTVPAVALGSCMPAPWDFPQWSSPGFTSFGFFGFPFAILGIAVYFLPTIIGAVRHAKSIVGIILVNIFAGWTGVGWIIALIWSLVGVAEKK